MLELGLGLVRPNSNPNPSQERGVMLEFLLDEGLFVLVP